MSTKTEKDIDYQEYMRSNDPNPEHDGLERRRKRRDSSKQRITIRLDEEVLAGFRKMVPEGRGYQKLINQALREWLAASEVKELVREELSSLVERAVYSIESAVETTRI